MSALISSIGKQGGGVGVLTSFPRTNAVDWEKGNVALPVCLSYVMSGTASGTHVCMYKSYINMHLGPTHVYMYVSFFLYVYVWYVMSGTASGTHVCMYMLYKYASGTHVCMHVCFFRSICLCIVRYEQHHIWDPCMYVCVI